MIRKPIAAGISSLLVTGLMMMFLMPSASAAASTGSIRGTVTTTTGTPLVGVMVNAYGTGGASAKTNVSGVYEITGLTPGINYVVSFAPADGSRVLGAYFGGGTTWESATRVSVASGTTTTGIDQKLVAGATISGRVLDESGHGLAGVLVNATNYTYYYQYQPYLGVEGFVTDANGYYSVYGLPTGSYRVQFVAPAASNLMSVYYGGGRDYRRSAIVKATAGTDSPLNVLTLHPGATISGVVSGPDGPVAGAQVVVGPDTSSNLRRSALTGADGSYSIGGVLTDTDVVVGFYAPATGANSSLRTEFWNDTSFADLATKLRLSSGQSLTGISPNLARASVISGVVSGPTGPAPGVAVRARKVCDPGAFSWLDEDCSDGRRAMTAVDGSYSLQVSAGSWLLGFDPAEGQSADLVGQIWNGRALPMAPTYGSLSISNADIITVSDGQQITNINPVLERGGAIAGNVTSGGAPAVGVKVVAVNDVLPDSSSEYAQSEYAQLVTAPRAVTGADGSYRIIGLRSGTYRLGFLNEAEAGWSFGAFVFASEWYPNKPVRSAADPIVVTAGSTLVADAVLDLSGSISGTIWMAGFCIPTVVATETTSPFRSRSFTPDSNPFTLRGLWPGTYLVRAEGCGTVHWYPGAAATSSAATPIIVSAGAAITGIPLAVGGPELGQTAPPRVPSPVVNVASASATIALGSGAYYGDGGSQITGYKATSIPEGKSCLFGPPETSCTITGLTNGKAYQFVVQATNAIGTGPMSDLSGISVVGRVITPTSPGKPLSVVAAASSTKATVLWKAPTSNGGSPVTGYTATAAPGGRSCSTTGSLSCVITGLSNRTAYTFAVTATNLVGTGQSSTSAAVTPRAVPDAPVGAVAVAGSTSATVRWSAPPSNGGSAITSYTVVSSPGSKTCTTSTLTCTFTGLTNGTTYMFKVTAKNSAGTGPAAVSTPSTPQPAFDAPTAVTAVAGNRVVSVAWVAPAATGGSTITGYVVTVTASGLSGQVIRTWSTTDLHLDITGLWNGVTYRFSVQAMTASRNGPSSIDVTSIPRPDPPGAPTDVSAMAATGSAAVTWTAPSSDGDSRITGYTVTSSPDGRTCSWSVGALSCTVTGLTNGTSYTFTVKATNATGDSAASSPSTPITPKGAPGSPTSVTGTAAKSSVMVSWIEPLSNGGAVITAYVVTASPGGRTCSWSSGPLICTITALTNGTSYTFAVVATNSIGTGSSSTPSLGVTPRTVPGAPRSVTRVAGNGSVTVSWLAPLSNGGAVINSYVVTASPGGRTCTWSVGALSCKVSGLTNGTSYTFTVKATNIAGTGAASTASTSVTPRP